MSDPEQRDPRSVLITGGSGFIGSRLGRLLAERGHRVTLVDHQEPDDDVLIDGRLISTAQGDVTDPSKWAHRLEGVDVVVHSAGIHRVDEVVIDPQRATKVNVGGTRAVLEAAVEYGVERFVFLSTSKVYGDVPTGRAVETDALAPADRYSHTKVAAEALCAAAHERGDIETLVVRPFSVYGPNQDVRTGYVGALVVAATTDSPASLAGAPNVVRDFVQIDTVVELLVALVEAPTLEHRIWNAGSGRQTTLDELVRTFVEVSALTQPVTYRTPSPGTVMRTSADMTRSHGLVGDDGRTLADGLLDTLNSYRLHVDKDTGGSE